MMEPMALGSPPSSPSTSPVNPNFLPAFLMGENQATSPRTSNISPSKNRTIAFKPTTPVPETSNRSRYFPQSPQEQTPAFNMSAVNEKSGPPSRGLFDTIDGGRVEFISPVKDSYTSPVQARSASFSRNLNESLNKSYRRQVIDNSDSMWVTVLGFPPHAASLVLSQFSQCGTIVEKKFPPEGNWVHIKYSSLNETAKALSFNGKFISNSIMIGVIPYTTPENKENVNASMNMSTINDMNMSVTSPNRARPLTQSYIPKQNSTDVLSPQNVPQKSTGIVSKAMEYVFGW